ncbi:DUF6496 domain-containing protein [Aestuariivirga litoralis]|uniref:DUF6496 domain-containing protein n=1 Tax=Aestuariivirga litoralis TaxID=2650924 RepID=UPI0018C4EE44|nr:DUF6496 domain-containing protein [Aestuariivirga litoralis]MBG1232789.1 hypothetical protein [Aestuariivirga litoralis]
MPHKYSAAAEKKIHTVMHEFKEGDLKGGNGDHPKVTSRKQAVAIALSEARAAGKKVPPKKKSH